MRNSIGKTKNSSITWLGEIPEEWKVKKLKFIAKIQTGGTPLKSDSENYSTNGTPWIKPDDLDELNFLTDSQERISEKGLLLNPIISKDDILVCCIGTVGKMGVAGCDLTFNQQINSIQFYQEIEKQFGKYLILSSQEEHLRNSQIVVVAILNKTKQSNISFPVPPLQTQKLISDYLDKKTAQIGKFIDDKKKMIELLKEQKQAIIYNAVTKGIDKNAKMKDSGIAWLGEIPEGWELNKIKHRCYVKGRVGFHGLNSSEFTSDKNLPYLVTGTDFDNNEVNWDSCYHISHDRYEEDLYIQLKENDLLITKDGTIGKTAVVKNKPRFATLNSGIMVVRSDEKLNSEFLNLIINSKVFTYFTDLLYQGSTIKHLYQQDFNNFQIILPSLDEQKKIVEFINHESYLINKAITKIQKEIELIEEYKKSLIFHAVTGKIDIKANG